MNVFAKNGVISLIYAESSNYMAGVNLKMQINNPNAINLITGSIKGQQSCPNSHILPTGQILVSFVGHLPH